MGQGNSSFDKYGIILPVDPWYKHVPCERIYTWSNIWNSDALGWWIVHIMVLPWWANNRRSDIHWEHEELSKPLFNKKVIIISWNRNVKNI